jgi:hypothetical protein
VASVPAADGPDSVSSTGAVRFLDVAAVDLVAAIAPELALLCCGKDSRTKPPFSYLYSTDPLIMSMTMKVGRPKLSGMTGGDSTIGGPDRCSCDFEVAGAGA